MPIVRGRRLTAFIGVTLLLVSASLRAEQRQSAQLPPSQSWNRDYDDALKAIDNKEFERAEALLQRALKNNPKAQRRVRPAGDRYFDYLPEYQLGRVYNALGRYQEAADMFSRARGLIGPKDPESAIYEQNVALAREKLVEQSYKPAQTQTPTPAPPTPTPVPPTPTPVPSPTPSPTRTPTPIPGLYNFTPTPTATPGPQPKTPSPSPSPQPTLSPSPAPTATPQPSPTPVPAPGDAERRALTAFYSGDYDTAFKLLQAVETPRGWFYFACSSAARNLLGASEPGLMATARAKFDAAKGRYDSTIDRRYISPAILALLEPPAQR